MGSPLHPVHLVLGLIVWALWFVALYGGLSVVCELAPPDAACGALTRINAAVLILALLVAVFLFRQAGRCWRVTPASGAGRTTERFIGWVGTAVYVASAVASLALGLPGMVLPPCV
jgi:hypothetical protein